MTAPVVPTATTVAAPASVQLNLNQAINKVSQQTGIAAAPVVEKPVVKIVKDAPVEAGPTDQVPPVTIAEPSAAPSGQDAATPLVEATEPTSELVLDDGTVILRAERNADGTFKTKFDPSAKLEFEIITDKKTGEKKSFSKTLPELTRLAKDGITLQQKVQTMVPEVDYYRKNVEVWAKTQAETTTKLTTLQQQYADMEALNRELLSADDEVVIGHRERYKSEMSPEKVAQREAQALREKIAQTEQTTRSLQAQSFIQARLAPGMNEANAVLGKETVAGIILTKFPGQLPPERWPELESFVNGPLKERVAQVKQSQDKVKAEQVAREAATRTAQATAQRAVNEAGRSTVPIGSASPDRAPAALPPKNVKDAMNKLINRPLPQTVGSLSG